MLELHSIPWRHVPWDELDRFADRTLFQTREWLEFVAETQHGAPVVAELRDGGALAGYFSGVLIRKLGVKILGSPFPGWTTPHIGFNLLPDTISRSQALEGLRHWAFGQMGCWHFEVSDWQFLHEGTKAEGLQVEPSFTYISDLTLPEDELFHRMTYACRKCIRKAEKSGVTIEEAAEAGFPDEHYAQLTEVFAKRGLKPTYGVERVRSLVRHLHPTGRLLLLRARNSEGRSIGTAIYEGFNRNAHCWGIASRRSELLLRPNEALNWYAMLYYKRKGIRHFDWAGSAGGRNYKEKYGGVPTAMSSFCGSRYQAIAVTRNVAHGLFYGSRTMLMRLRGFSLNPLNRLHSLL